MTELEPHPPAPAEGEQEAYCIISGNIRQDIAINQPNVALQDIEAAVGTYHPDILCLQEATVAERDNKHSGYLGKVATNHELQANFTQTAQLKRRQGYIHSGLANLVRPEIEATTTEVSLSSSRTNRLRPVRRRSLLITTINDDKRSLHVVNAHLSIPLGLNWRTRRAEWKKLFETVDTLEGDVVISGDFNVGPKSKLVKWCNERWQPISDQTLPTWHNLKKVMQRTLPPRMRTIDYVFTNKDFRRQIQVKPMDRGSSDHTWHAITIDKHMKKLFQGEPLE